MIGDLPGRIREKLSQLESPELFTLKCPNCGTEIANFKVTIYLETGSTPAPFSCPACGSLICVSSLYARSVFLGLLALAFMIPATFSVHPWYLWFGVGAVSWIVLCLLSSVYVKVLFPPKLLVWSNPNFPSDQDKLSLKIWRKP
jgi:predicted RNA-binding Zn-ribbon protein involved in translation (DUF1610 family)